MPIYKESLFFAGEKTKRQGEHTLEKKLELTYARTIFCVTVVQSMFSLSFCFFTCEEKAFFIDGHKKIARIFYFYLNPDHLLLLLLSYQQLYAIFTL